MSSLAMPGNGETVARPRRGRPPGNRRALILREATRLFYERGFHGTSISEIGAAAGVKGPTVYRHFPDKNAVLAALIEESAERSEAEIAQIHREGGTPRELLERLIRSQARQATDDGPLTAIAARELRSLSPETSEPLLRRSRINQEEWVSRVGQARPELSADQARTLVVGAKWLIFTIATGRTGLDGDRLCHLIIDMTFDLLLPRHPHDTSGPATEARPSHQADRRVSDGADPASPVGHVPPGPTSSVGGRAATGPVPERAAKTPAPLASSERRELIIREAARLFVERGYHATGVDEIGGAVGITGPALYHHVKGKDELLLAIMQAEADRSEVEVAEVYTADDSARQLLKALVGKRARRALTDAHLMAVGARELQSLPSRHQQPMLRRKRLNREEWVHLVAESRPDLRDPEARAMVDGIKALIFGLVISGAELHVDQMEALVLESALAVLFPHGCGEVQRQIEIDHDLRGAG
ncbi:TetR family transcriptional regulator [Nonomuraea sp. NPDC052129]|uniref:TetR/AcrR family transcriptional regulator n=1 Tax=Nonomuraea sp. NPDC052129 TaxID=3154651 RepID=UPI003425BC7C